MFDVSVLKSRLPDAISRHVSPEGNVPIKMRHSSSKSPRCIIIAGPNGAGKTTFAREFLPKDARVIHFVNADLIAGGLSPLRPELATLAGGRLFLAELDRLARARVDFAFESTLSGLVYLNRLKRWKSSGYHIEISYLRLSSPRLGIRRIAARVKQGGHHVPRADVLRRFNRSWLNFQRYYCPLADAWAVYDNSGKHPVLLEQGP
ncbi:MAG TPA: Zeta toxin family protein [Verrucomicrobiae bacterium]|nr:Zeta toxin family protein [Verrucomicrobiae bacterium]